MLQAKNQSYYKEINVIIGQLKALEDQVQINGTIHACDEEILNLKKHIYDINTLEVLTDKIH
jgi:hypothetical protein